MLERVNAGIMEGFTIIDVGVILVVALSGFLAHSRGIVRESMAILSWIIAIIAAFTFAPQIEPLIRELPVVGEFIADSCELSMIAAAAAIFIVILLITSLITPVFSTVVQDSILGEIDHMMGFIFGVLRGVLLVAIIFFVYETIVSSQSVPIIDDSRSAKILSNFAEKIAERNPEQALSWVTRQFEKFVAVCDPSV